ncbi:MAG TPA: serine hydrolase domain-containing protein [Rhizomicrobium sp.]|nr:serine hydrolase domain-containing protein [Rhizomicrobium sp.]
MTTAPANRWTTRDSRLFTGAAQVENFRSMSTIYPVRVIRRAPKPAPLATGKPMALPESFAVQDRTVETARFLAEVETTGLLVLKDGRLIYENYWLGNDATTQTISWSVVKSFVSALMGIAIHEGAIRSLEDPVTRYVPGLAGSGYDGVRIKDVLQMSSGMRWNEDYSDRESDINVFGRVFRRGESLDAFAARCVRGREPGTYNLYNSTDTHVIGMVLRHATGRSLAEYLKEKLWDPIGAEADAFWIVDDKGAEMAGGGLNAVLRDYARLGLLYQNGGARDGVQIVPEAWVRASVTPDAPHLMPGPRPSALLPSGYGYQWWVPDDSGVFAAIGIYNQYVYVDPKARVVIAKSSAFRGYAASTAPEAYKSVEHFALFKAIAAAA